MRSLSAPPIWLLIFIVGLPILSENIYTPALPDIAKALLVSESLTEYTLTVYLAGFAIGTLFWGSLSDRFGRKPCLLMSLCIYIVGCVGCYLSSSIELLMLSRLVQAIGGSSGSVLGQAIARDAFQGPNRGKVFSVVTAAIGFAPAIGPVLGGVMDQAYGWSSIFLLLIILGGLVLGFSLALLPETHKPSQRSSTSFWEVASRMVQDRKVIGFGILVAACNGIIFSYFAEGSFYLIEILKLSPSQYGASYILLAAAGIIGGWHSKKLHDRLTSFDILQRGIWITFTGAGFFLGMTILFSKIMASSIASIALTLSSMVIMMYGIVQITSNTLSMALENYQQTTGKASSLFGFFYYSLISLVTLGMGTVHNNTLLPMPLYFFGVASAMLLTDRLLIRPTLVRSST